ncbi:MAG: putative multidrug resistance protein NorM [Planctomycetota bacterium]|nr:MAG: putative multidrug resistance protein NorM [Planctomycetota bacterium]
MKDTTTQPPWRAILALAVPASLSFLLQNLYHVNDAWFLGRLGGSATNAMGLFMMVAVANFGFILTLARGTQSLVGRRFGARNLEGTQLAIAQGLRLALLVLIPLGALELIFAPEILGLLGGEGDTVDAGTAYVRTLLCFLPFMFAAPLLEFCLQALGDARTPFKLQLVAVSVNTLLNFLLVLPHELRWADGALSYAGPLVNGGVALPFFAPGGEGTWSSAGLGVVGAAVATGCSRMVSSLLAFRVLVRRHGLRLLLRAPSYRADRRVAAEIFRVGLPAGSSTFLFAAVGFVLLRIISRFGQDALGAYAIGFRAVESVSFMVVLGFGAATGMVVAHSIGAGLLDRARRAAHVGAALCAAPMLVTTAVMLSASEGLASLFTPDVGIQAIAASYIVHMGWCQVPQSLEMIYGDAMAGAGSSLRAALISIPGNVLRVPAAWVLAVEFELGLLGVWYAIIGSAVLKGAAMCALFLSGRWEQAMHEGRQNLNPS